MSLINFEEGGLLMEAVLNLDNKRVCDISMDARAIEIRRKDCITRITAKADGTLHIVHKHYTGNLTPT